MKDTHKKGYPWIILVVAVAIVFGLSFVPWGKLTGNHVKDYDLLADVHAADSTAAVASNEYIDPELAQELADSASAIPVAKNDTAAAKTIVTKKSPRVNGDMVIEDYTPDGRGLSRLKAALQNPGKTARIAVLGDSYIEGDILTQDIREDLQSQYGGGGVGYMPAYSQVAGFRRTVQHSSQGWKQQGIQKASKTPYFNLAGEYFTAPGPATVTYKGTKGEGRLVSWNNSRLVFIAPNDGRITLTTDNDTLVVDVAAAENVQQLSLPGETKTFKISVNAPGLIFLGAWLEDDYGVVVDCMSIRGDSGITHRNLSVNTATQLRNYTDYDLIILEYGINALSASQSNYSHYGNMMTQVAEKVKECYPNSDILMLGIGDRGQKVNGAVHSLPTSSNMVDAQREAAQKAQVLFWDTREAMGGEEAVVDWRNRKLINGDYIHLNAAGGKELADALVKSLNAKLNE